MNRNKKNAAILIAILSLMTAGYSVSAQSRATSNPAAAESSAKSKVTKRAIKIAKKNRAKSKKGDDKIIRNGDTLILPMKYYGVSESLSDLARQNLPPVSKENGQLQEVEPMEVLRDVDEPKKNENDSSALPPQIQTVTSAPLAAIQGTNFEGPGTGLAGFSLTGAPPDTTMAVGKNHIVAWVNSQYAIFNKTGTLLLGPVNGNALFTGVGGVCETTNRGDPILQYDRFADRWILSQFAFASGPAAPYLQCIAVSTTNDPTGTYYRYSITFGSTTPDGFNDYGKIGVWNDAYYTAYNVFGGSPAGANTGAALCASDRTKMLAGDGTATTLCAPTANYASGAAFLPADIDGTQLPTDTTRGGVFMRVSTGTGQLRYLRFKPNFTAGTATLTDGYGGATGSFVALSPSAPILPCNGASGTCVPQPGTTNKLDTLGDRLMYRLVYRNRNGVDNLIVTRSVDPDAAGVQNAQVAWYVISNPLANPADVVVANRPSLLQNSIYNPTTTSDRWMSSMAMDKFGNMLMGYSISNALTTKPSIAIAGRQSADVGNTLQAEIIDTTGTGSQTGTLTRWGDYSTMQIDPADDNTFWYTTEYLSADGTFNWRTRITSYKFPITVTTATSDGNISDGTKFDNGAPNSTLNVVIPTGRTITVNTPTTVNSLTVAGGATLIMNANLTVQGDLTLGTKIDTGANTLGLGCVSNVIGASASNYIIGNLQKDYCGVGVFSFPTGTANGYSPVNTNVTTLTTNPSSLLIKANQGNRSGMTAINSLQRYWTLSKTAGNLTTDLVFNYNDPLDIAGVESSYALYRFVGATGTAVTPFTLNTGANTMSTTGISAFSDWAIGTLVTTAAGVTVSGRVLNSSGYGVRNAVVILTDSNGNSRSAITSSFGYYHFDEVEAGQTYAATVRSKRYQFATRLISVTDTLADLDFVAEP